MHVLVLGAGVIGVTTAWYLANAGFEVGVIDRQAGAGLETSFANGGQISLGHPEPWSSPSAPFNAIRWLGRKDAPLRFHFAADPERLVWALAFLRECLPHRFHRNMGAIASLAAHSGRCLRALRDRTGIEYEAQQRGILHLFRTERELHAVRDKPAFLASHGIRAHLCTAAECVEIEPALAHLAGSLAGGLHASGDESGNALLFTRRLAALAQTIGVRFHYERTITRIATENGAIRGIGVRAPDGDTDELHADAYVVCLGSHASPLLVPLGERLPIHPVKGYSITLPLLDPDAAPRISLTDESERIVCSRLGDQLRVAGTAEIGGFDTAIDADRCRQLLQWTERAFPGAADPRAISPWAGLRPCTPSNVPIIGRGRHPELWFNTGHGSLGWTLACGSAQLVTTLLRGQSSSVPGFPLRGMARRPGEPTLATVGPTPG